MEITSPTSPIYRITIPGLLRAKGRPRFGNGRTFTDAKTVQAEKHIQRHAKEQIGKPCLTGQLLTEESLFDKRRCMMMREWWRWST